MNLKKAATWQIICKTPRQVNDVNSMINKCGKHVIFRENSTLGEDVIITLLFKSQRALHSFEKAYKKAGWSFKDRA